MSEHKETEEFGKGGRFVDIHRCELSRKVTMVEPVVEDLRSLDILDEKTYLQIMGAKTNQEQMKKLYEALDERGDKAKSAFYFALMMHEATLIHEIGGRFVNIHRYDLIYEAIMMKPVIKDLRSLRIINAETYSQIRSATTNQEQMRKLYDILDEGGDEAKSALYVAFVEHEPKLIYGLGGRFVKAHKFELINEVTKVIPVIEDLWSQDMLSAEICKQIKRAKTNLEQMRKLYAVLDAGGDEAKSAFYFALMEHEPQLIHHLGEVKNLHQRNLEFWTTICQYKTIVMDNCKFVTEYNLSSNESVQLAVRYIEPEMLQRGEEYGEIMSSTKIDKLFSPGRNGKTPKTVILSGDSGCGKSFILQKIMLDWASKEVSLIKFVVFFLKCKELMCISEMMSLVELLTRSCSLTSHQITQILQSSPERVLIIIDGYNDLKFPDTSHRATCMDTIDDLLNGHILPESSLLITTRSVVAVDVYTLKKPTRFIEIMGFSESGVEKYFQKFFQDEQLFRKAYDCVKANETLQIACSVPLVCWMVCICLKYLPDGEDEIKKLETNTSIYVHFVSKLLKHHCKIQPAFNLLKCLGQLAERGWRNQQVLFEEKSLTEAGLVSDTSLFLKKDCFKRKDKEDPVFKFIHLNFQEFFTALHYVLLDDKSCSAFVRQRFNSLKMEAETSSPSQHLRGRNSCHIPFIWFLCGLSNEKVSSALFTKDNWTVPHVIREELEVMISRPENNNLLLALHCLYELHDEEFVRKVLKGYRSLTFTYTHLRKTDCWVLLYCLQCCPHITDLILSHCDLTADKLKILQPALCMREKLRVQMDKCNGEQLSITKKDLLFCVSHSQRKPSFPSLLKISLTCPDTEISHFNWTSILQTLENKESFAKRSLEFDEHLSLLLSSFHFMDLKKLDLELVSLTKSWTAAIIFIISIHTSLQELSVSVSGLLLEDELVSLQESLTDPHCSVTIKGWKCNKPAEKCTEKDWSLSCNEEVMIDFKPNVLKKLEALNISNPEPSKLNLNLPDCECCGHIVDCDEWVHVEPSVCSDEGESKFRISTGPGHYECTRTTMRWVCDCDVTLQYHVMDGRSLIAELERLQCERIGPVIDVTVISGTLTEAHLPHFACLAESDPSLKDAVKVLSQKDEGIELQPVELTRFHAKLVQPSFSIKTVVMGLLSWIIEWEKHCNLLLYMRCRNPLILHIYFFPFNDTCSKEKVEQSERSSLQINHPRPNRPFRMNTPHLLDVPDASVHPVEGISFRINGNPNFFKIRQDRDGDVQMTLIREEDRSAVWKATIREDELDHINPRQMQNEPHAYEVQFVNENYSELVQRVNSVMAVADDLKSKMMINEEKYSMIKVEKTNQDKMRKLYEAPHAGGDTVKTAFYYALRDYEPYLFAQLVSRRDSHRWSHLSSTSVRSATTSGI